MIERTHRLSVTCRARLVGLSPASVYSAARPMSETELALMRRMGITAIYQRPKTTRHQLAFD